MIGSSDLTYHVLWVVLATTLDESGIYELRQIERGDAFGSTIELHQMRVEAEAMRQKISDEALHGALRISALVRFGGILRVLACARADWLMRAGLCRRRF
jgi:hypothetical protein